MVSINSIIKDIRNIIEYCMFLLYFISNFFTITPVSAAESNVFKPNLYVNPRYLGKNKLSSGYMGPKEYPPRGSSTFCSFT